MKAILEHPMKKPDVVLTLSYEEAQAYVKYWGPNAKQLAGGYRDEDYTYSIALAIQEALESK